MSQRRFKKSAADSRVEAVQRFAERADSRAAINALCRQLFSQSGQKEPPFDPGVYAQSRGPIHILEEQGVPTHGLLERSGTNFVIKINSDLAITRKRFVACHELIHTFFEEAATKFSLHALGRNGHSPEEERLCDWGAAQLLMPDSAVKRMLNGREINVALVKEASSLFQVSLQVASRRIVDCSDRQVCVVHWIGSSGYANRVHFTPREYSNGFPRVFSEATEGISRCYKEGEQIDFELRIPGHSGQKYLCESVPVQRLATARGDVEGCIVLSVLRPI
jgi:hypothetical protein